MNKDKNKLEDLSIGVKSNINKMLVDKRLNTSGMYFGRLGNVAKQYGIKCYQCDGYLKFTAPKSRLQIFVEKLHFSCIKYFNL